MTAVDVMILVGVVASMLVLAGISGYLLSGHRTPSIALGVGLVALVIILLVVIVTDLPDALHSFLDMFLDMFGAPR